MPEETPQGPQPGPQDEFDRFLEQTTSADENFELSTGYKTLAFVWEVLKIVIIVLAIVLPIKLFIMQPFFVRGASMEPTFDDNDYILIDELSYRFKEPHRGDIVVFRFPNDRSQFLIKRIIALPEETIEIRDNTVYIYNNDHPGGVILNEDYLADGQQTRGAIRYKLDDNEYFVMGDNRLNSSDSRFWGPVNKADVTGRVFARAWPISSAELFDDPAYENVQRIQ